MSAEAQISYEEDRTGVVLYSDTESAEQLVTEGILIRTGVGTYETTAEFVGSHPDALTVLDERLN